MQIDGNFSAKHHGVLDLSFFISALVRYNVRTVILPQMSHVSSFLWASTNFLSASASVTVGKSNMIVFCLRPTNQPERIYIVSS